MKNHTRLILFFCLLNLSCLTCGLHAALEISSAVLVAGDTMVRGSNMNAFLRFSLTNSGTRPAEVQLTAEPLDGDKSAVYVRKITLPPRSVLSDRMPIFIVNSERYLVSLIHRGQRMDKEEILLRNDFGTKALRAMLVNDHDENYPGDIFRNNAELNYKINADLFRSANLPSHWGLLQDYSIVVLVRPDFRTFSLAAMQALRDYVLQGGVLYIASAEAALELKNTPLNELLPAEPLGMSNQEGLNCYRRALGRPEREEPFRNEYGEQLQPFRNTWLQAVPRTRAVSVLNTKINPLGYARYYGLGLVVQLTSNPLAVFAADRHLGTALWNVCLACPFLSYDYYLPQKKENVNRVLQNLQGYKIPSVILVMKIFWWYFIPGMILLLLLLKKKKVALGWAVFAGYGVIMTGVIFRLSQKVADNQPDKALISVTVSARSAASEGRGPVLAVGNVISKTDCRADVSSSVSRAGYYPQKRNWMDNEKEAGMTGSTLRIQQDSRQLSLPRIALQQLRPKTVCWTISSEDYGRTALKMPELLVGRQKTELVPWTFPGQKDRAMLLLPGEIRNLVIDGDTIRDGGNLQVENDVVLGQAQKYLSSLKLQAPALAVLQIRSTSDLNGIKVREKDAEYANYDYHFELIPLRLKMVETEDGLFWCGRDLMRQEIPSETASRQYFRYGEWQEVMSHAMDYSNIGMCFRWPLQIRLASAEKIRIRLDVVNPSGKCRFTPVLLTEDGRELTFSSRTDQIFEFTGDSLQQALHQKTRSIRVRLKVVSEDEGQENIHRMDHWKILCFQAEILGKTEDALRK